MRVGRGRKIAMAVAGLALLAACGTPSQAAEQTVTSFVTVGPGTSDSPSSEPAASPSPSPAESPSPSSTPAASSPAAPADPNAAPQDGVAMADGFVPKKLQPGEKPPQ